MPAIAQDTLTAKATITAKGKMALKINVNGDDMTRPMGKPASANGFLDDIRWFTAQRSILQLHQS